MRKASMRKASFLRVSGPEIVYIEWIDSCRTEGWCTHREIENVGAPMECRTVGFLVREDDRSIVLALSAAHGDHVGSPYCSLMTIPKKSITLRASSVQAFYSTAAK